jgi:hypothetical protein
MTNAKEPTKPVKGESPLYLVVTCRSEDDIAARVTLFAKHVAEHGGADVNVSPNYTIELTRIHASFRELPNNPIQFREQLEQAGFIDPCFIRGGGVKDPGERPSRPRSERGANAHTTYGRLD